MLNKIMSKLIRQQNKIELITIRDQVDKDLSNIYISKRNLTYFLKWIAGVRFNTTKENFDDFIGIVET